ncbi:MAG: hypothetical protein HYU66_09340, partial [Armatimonadetes bacterium]|nr:hypothetical protein [Armatimonadota bacterium]
AANFLLGLRAFADDPVVLFATSDLPFIDAAAIDEVASRGVAGAGLCYPYFSKDEVRAVFPHEANSYLKLRDGDITGSSVFLLGPHHVLPREAEIRAFFEARKNIPRLVGMLGLDLALRMVLTKKLGLRVLTVAALERRFGKLAGFPVAAVRGCSPRCSLDIDHERDLAEALAHVGQA